MQTTNSFNTYVNHKEAAALKEMIFNRARERVTTMTEELDNSYISSTQNDIMDMARISFMSDTKNPFAQVVEEGYKKAQEKEVEIKETPVQKIVNENERQTAYREKINAENVIQTRAEMMAEASASFTSPSKSFIGALNFLNSQATVSLFRKNGKNFDVTI